MKPVNYLGRLASQRSKNVGRSYATVCSESELRVRVKAMTPSDSASDSLPLRLRDNRSRKCGL